jgi:hypothetical protein
MLTLGASKMTIFNEKKEIAIEFNLCSEKQAEKICNLLNAEKEIITSLEIAILLCGELGTFGQEKKKEFEATLNKIVGEQC